MKSCDQNPGNPENDCDPPFLRENFNIRDYLDTSNMSEDQIDKCEFWVSAEIAALAEQAFQALGELLSRIGIWDSKSKCTKPNHIAVFLGILYNTMNMTMELTKE